MLTVKRLVLLAAVCAACLPVTAAQAADRKPFKPKLDAPTAADYRTVDPQNLLVIETTKGRVMVELMPEIAPKSVARIKELAHEHFYDNLAFHRVIDDFMAQGGDPNGDGSGGSSKPDVPGEFVFRRGADTPYVAMPNTAGQESGFIKSMPVHGQNSGLMVMTADGKVQSWGVWCKGVAGMARAAAVDSANSQFYLMRGYNDALDHQYTPFGRVVDGQAVVQALKTGEPVVNPDKMTSVRIMADLPAAQQTKVQVVDSTSAYVKAELVNAQDVCDVEFPVKLN